MLSVLRKPTTSVYPKQATKPAGRGTSNAGGRPFSSLAQFRRKAEKKNLQVKPDPTSHYFMFPRERLGVDYDLNAVLNAHHRLTPYGDAFRNLYSRHLLMLASGKLDGNKALVQESDPASAMSLYYVRPELNPAFTPSGSTAVVSDATFRKLGRMITDHIGDSANIFVLDAAVGSHRLGEMNVRVITNSANVNLYLKHMLPRQGNPHLWTFPYQMTVYIAPDMKVSELESLGLNSAQNAIVNLERGIMFVAGTTSLQAVREAITAAVTSRILQDAIPSLGLNATVVSKKGKTAVVIDPANQLGELQLVPEAQASSKAASAKAQDASKNAKAKKSAEDQSKALFTAHLPEGVVGLSGAIWNHYGVYRMFEGITHKNEKVPRQRGDIVERIKAASASAAAETHITQPLKDLPNELPSPSAVVFLIADQNALLPSVAKLNAAQASKFLSMGYNGSSTEKLTPFFHAHGIVSQPGQVEKLFDELLSSASSFKPNPTPTSVFVVNTLRKDGSSLSPKEIDAIVSAATDGSLASAKTEKDSVFKYDIITKVPGVSSSLDITQGWSNKQDYSKQAQKLASILSS